MSQQISSRKRKQTQSAVDLQPPAAKKSKISKHSPDKKRKHKYQDTTARDHGEFQVVKSSLVVSIPPIYASNPKQGVQEMLDGMLMRYIPALKGVVISHTNLQFLDRTTTIKADCPFAVCRVAFDATVWSPRVGSKLLGKVNLCSPDHISLLVHQVFNASIPRHHIPTDHWEFEYGPAENDPEFAPEIASPPPADEDEDIEMDQEPDTLKEDTEATEPVVEVDEDKTANDGGQWVHKLSSEKIGGPEGYVEFTVIGLTMANQMLSLVGSIQSDPFSPHHVPTSSSPTLSQEEAAVLNELELDAADPSGDSDDDSQSDPFAQLGKIADKSKEAERRAREDAAQKEKPKKKKRKAAEKEEVVVKEKKTKRKKS